MPKLGIINGLRGFAILAVIYHHIFSSVTTPGFGSFNVNNITFLPFTYLSNGWLGVNLFFMLSGFVLSYPYFLRKRDFKSVNSIKEFYFHRAKRLLPLYYVSVVFSVVFIVHPVSINSFVKEALILATVTFNFTFDMWFPRYNMILWSLGIEIWFSIVFPFLIISVRKYGILHALFVVLAISLITRIIGNAQIYDIGNPILNPVKDSLLGRLDVFLWGIFLCDFYVNKIEQISQKQGTILFFMSIIMITIACFLWDYVRLNLLTGTVIPFIYIVVDVGFFMLALSLLSMKDSIIKWIFSNYVVQLLGVMCYSLYIWHYIAIPKIITILDAGHILMYFLLVFLLSSLSYRFIEFGHEPNVKRLFLLDTK